MTTANTTPSSVRRASSPGLQVGPDLLADLGLSVAVLGDGKATRYCAWALRRLGVHVVDSLEAASDIPIVMDGHCLIDAPVAVHTWDFQVGEAGDGALASSVSGISWVLGFPGLKPAVLPLDLPEKWTGLLAASLVLTRFVDRGRVIGASSPERRASDPQLAAVYDVSAADVLHSFARQNFGNHIEEPNGWRRNGRFSPNHGGIYPQGLFPCADGFVAAVARSRHDWDSILAVLDNPEWADNEAIRDPIALAANPSVVESDFAAELQKHTRDELFERCVERRATLAPVYSRAEAAKRHLVRDSFRTGPDAGNVGLPFNAHRLEPDAPGERRRRPGPQTRPELPLDGLRVIEMCWIWAGPLIGQLLADLGAEVIKVEWFDRADPYRIRGIERRGSELPLDVWRESSPSFHSLNRNKVGFTVNLKSPEGFELLLRVAAESDALICNYTTGTLARLGLTNEALSRANPDIAVVTAGGFGSGTPMEAMPAYGLTVSALAGIEREIVAEEGGFIGSPTFVVSDPNAALFSLLATIASIVRGLRRSGSTSVEVSQLEAAISIAGDMDVEHPLDGVASVRIFRTAEVERYVAVDTSTISAMVDLDRWCGERTTEQVMTELVAAGAVAVPVQELLAARTSPTYADCDVALASSHPITGPELLVAAPWRVSGARAPLRKAAPGLGEGVDYVLRRVLRLPTNRIAELMGSGVVTRSASADSR
jgi:crotonobetainyl-CoA:carnitine CoA-transferase CaiB-like acyl-CoA transferase